MARGEKWDKFKEWLSRSFSPKGRVRYMPDGPERQPGPGAFFSHAQGFALHNPLMSSVHGDHNTVTYVLGDRNLVSQIMGSLSQRIIPGAAHDSSARSLPPRCHPDSRIKLIARIMAWFNGQGQQELVLWITSPAGVGKSAVVQTFAEHLVKLKLLGASVFFSRSNKRNNPLCVFITTAYQLAIRNEMYSNFVVERLSHDPELLNGDLQAQFTTFIVEPFVEKKIGTGGRQWGILLDGLDELDGEDAQCEIINLITTFAHEHPDAPLAWIIASRPESHISNTFDDDDVCHRCRSEYIPIDSTEASDDVERFLRSSFKTIRKKFRYSVPSDWPSDTDFLKVTAAASGLFIYAEVVMRFIRDPHHADPASRFKVLLSVIDRSDGTSTKEDPFIHLDALYHEILSSTSQSNLWPTAKQLLGFVSCQGVMSNILRGCRWGSLRGMSILLDLTPHVIYTCVLKYHSTLRVPDLKGAHKEPLRILHASFADYLKNPARSGKFYAGNDRDLNEDMGSRLLAIWNECSGDDIGTMEAAWHRYCLKLDDKPSRAITKFHGNLFQDVVSAFRRVTVSVLEQPAESPVYAELRQVHMIKPTYYFDAEDMSLFVASAMHARVNDIGLLRRIHLKDLKFGHLDWQMMSPARAHQGRSGRFSKEQWILHRPRSRTVLETFISELESIQEHSPELDAAIFGGVPEGRDAAFRTPLRDRPELFTHYMYYVIPYPE